MRVGEEIEAWLHPRKGYHKDGNSAIPGNALLHFVSLRVEDFGNEEAGEWWYFKPPSKLE